MECYAVIIFRKKSVDINGKKMNLYLSDDVSFGIHEDGYVSKIIPLVGKYKGKRITYFLDADDGITFFPFKYDYFVKVSNYNLYDFTKNEGAQLAGNIYKESKNDKYKLEPVKDKWIIREAQKAFHIDEKREFSESSMINDSDISKLYKNIKKTIISQDKQIMMILTSLFKNNRVINSSLSDDMVRKLKENILIAGPTGTGKTEIITRISKDYDLPIVIADSTSLSETGYAGRNVEDLLSDLYIAADKNLEKAQKGILVIDEFDKLAEKNDQAMVSRSGVQRSLLKILDGSRMYFDGMMFDTSKLTVIGLGAFSGIKEKESYDNISTEDLTKYGIMQELVGRFSKVIKMNSLSKSDLKRILLESDLSPLNTYKSLFDEMGVSFSYDDKFVDFIAEKAEQLDTGARSLKTIFDEQISGALFSIFAGDYKNISLTSPDENGISYKLEKTNTKKHFWKKK